MEVTAATREVDWTELPAELIESISKALKVHIDYVHIQAVCRTWRSSIPKTPSHLPPQLPWLMLPQSPPTNNRSSSSSSSRRPFFDLSTNKYRFLHLPEASQFLNNRYCGSSHGWLVILDDSPAILLLNPLTRAKMNLPPLSSFPVVVGFSYSDIGREYRIGYAHGEPSFRSLRQMRDWFIKKVVLSSSPSAGGDFAAFAILNETGDLAYCKQGYESWIMLGENALVYCEDVVWFNGLFYAVDKFGQILVCDVNGDSHKVSFIETAPSLVAGDMHYLVGSGDDLMLVTRYLDVELQIEPHILPHLVYITVRFEVFRLDSSRQCWERIRSLGDRMLFIGGNSSLSLLASDFSGCCLGNCIYFTDDYSETNYEGQFGESDVGIFKLCDGSIESLPCYPRNSHSRSQWPPPLWVSPNP